MTPSFVVDCSVAMAWCFGDEATPATEAVLSRLTEEAAVVPSLWFLEVANVLTLAERRGRILEADLTRYLDLLFQLEIEVDQTSPRSVFGDVLALARSYRLTSYDAAYLELSIRQQLPLDTLDQDLRAAAESAGVELLG